MPSYVVQKAVCGIRRAVVQIEHDPLRVRAAAPEKGCEAIDGIVRNRLKERAPIRADLLPERIRLRLARPIRRMRGLMSGSASAATCGMMIFRSEMR